MAEETLFQKLGGKDAVNAAVDIFYKKVLADSSISQFFDTVDMDRQIGKQKAFLIYAFGGSPNYSGKSMREGHAHLVEQGLNDDHFNAVAGHLQASLEELNVPADLVGEVMAIAGSTREDVLGRST